LAQDYRWHYRVFSEGDSTDLEVRAFRALNPQKDGLYLNYGCGQWSKTNQILREEGWNILGFDPHATHGGDQTGLIIATDHLMEFKFDGIFSNNVIEHFRYPVNELKFMKSLLKQGGKMSHATSCYEYLYEFTRFHMYFFTGRSREFLAAQAELILENFEVDGEYMCCVFAAPYVQS
jgi:SAM-dependent methyltransferase